MHYAVCTAYFAVLLVLAMYGLHRSHLVLTVVRHRKKLRAIDIQALRDMNTGLRELKDMKQLRSLRIIFGLRDENLPILAEFTQLEHLDIRVQASAEELQRLKKALPDCVVEHLP